MVATIVGTGNSALAMACHLSLNGHPVRIWGRSKASIDSLRRQGAIDCYGVISGQAPVEFVTNDLREALEGSRLVLITTPASAHRDIAIQLASALGQSEVDVVLNPGRTGGALEVQAILNAARVNARVAEAQTIIYTCRALGANKVNIIKFKSDVLLSLMGGKRQDTVDLINNLPLCLQGHFVPARSPVETSIGNVGMILHCVPTLLNIGWIECPKVDFKYYYEGITPTIASLLERLDNERLAVGRSLGFELESTTAWLRRTYGVEGDTLYDCIRANDAYKTIDAPSTVEHRYLTEDVPCGLVPLEALGKLFGLRMPLTTMFINITNQILGRNYRRYGRSLKRLGLSDLSAAEVKKLFS